MHVVGRQELHIVTPADVDQPVVDGFEFVNRVVLQFEIEILFAEDLKIPVDQVAGGVVAPIHDHAGNLGGEAAAGDDQAFAVRCQIVVVDARAIVVALKLRGAGDLEQVFVADFVFRQHEQVIRATVDLRVAVGHAAVGRGDVAFHAEDRLDPGFFAGVVEVDDAEHDAVIGDRQRLHAEFGGAI